MDAKEPSMKIEPRVFDGPIGSDNVVIECGEARAELERYIDSLPVGEREAGVK